ncbi:MAG: TIGR03619 family F420-dependent LLM class oxidoreductase [Dehalococcoidia bacterium]
MRFGVNILNFSDGATPESIRDRAQTAESMGFHSVMISDHVAITPGVRSRYPEPFYDTFATLAWLAAQTSTVQLGTTVVVLPYRHPVLTARLAANVDQFSGGRFILGVGVGGAEDEFRALGVPFNRRGALTNEYLEVISALWTQDEVSYKGRSVTLEGVSGIRTVSLPGRPHPPIWVGGRSDAAMRRTIRFGASWHPNRITMAWLRDQGLPRLRELAADAGSPMPAFCPRIPIDLREDPVEGDERPAGVGTLEQVQADLQELESLGAVHVLFDWYVSGEMDTARDDERGWRMLSLLAEQVIDVKGEALR